MFSTFVSFSPTWAAESTHPSLTISQWNQWCSAAPTLPSPINHAVYRTERGTLTSKLVEIVQDNANSTAVFITQCLASNRCHKRMLLCLSKPCTNIIMLDYICFLYLITTTTNKKQYHWWNIQLQHHWSTRNMLWKTKQKNTHEICHCKGLKLYGKRQSSSLF